MALLGLHERGRRARSLRSAFPFTRPRLPGSGCDIIRLWPGNYRYLQTCPPQGTHRWAGPDSQPGARGRWSPQVLERPGVRGAEGRRAGAAITDVVQVFGAALARPAAERPVHRACAVRLQGPTLLAATGPGGNFPVINHYVIGRLRHGDATRSDTHPLAVRPHRCGNLPGGSPARACRRGNACAEQRLQGCKSLGGTRGLDLGRDRRFGRLRHRYHGPPRWRPQGPQAMARNPS